MGKKINFDVFALITPIEKPVEIELVNPKAGSLSVEAYLLAVAIRRNQFVLPQVLLLGEQVTKGPSPVRYLQFDRYEVPDYALKKVISQLSNEEKQYVQQYLWDGGRLEYDRANRRYIEIDTPFPIETEKAFHFVYSMLKQLNVLRPRQRKMVDDGKYGMPRML